MEKIKQHHMIPVSERNFHPLFSLSYFAENAASLAETTLLLMSALSAVAILPCFVINIFNINTSSNLVMYVYYSYLSNFFDLLRLSNSTISNIGVFVMLVTAYYFLRKYFEFVKYNFHILRNIQIKKGLRKP